MGKLVRDKIPDIIRASGRIPRVTTLAEVPYRAALLDKLREEVDELIAAHGTDAVIEEAADILEVLVAIAGERGASVDTIADTAQRKRAEKGGFDMRLWLDGVDPTPASR
ncbi:phosphoribosyl-ATP pyrophosphohydrolase [Mycobacterium kansasii]|nr:phosphoribosyl-ATP pyrophosphohydrolase [Mycobacterium kansasii]